MSNEKAIQRRITEMFIRADPTTVVLIPRVKTTTPSGASVWADGPPRPPQTFKLVLLAYDQRPTVTVAGVARLMDYHLIGKYTAKVEVNDYWIAPDGTRFDVGALTDGFGYETKALVVRTAPPDKVVR